MGGEGEYVCWGFGIMNKVGGVMIKVWFDLSEYMMEKVYCIMVGGDGEGLLLGGLCYIGEGGMGRD